MATIYEQLQERFPHVGDLYAVIDELRDTIGEAELLDALISALGTDELQDLAAYIARTYDV